MTDNVERSHSLETYQHIQELMYNILKNSCTVNNIIFVVNIPNVWGVINKLIIQGLQP